MNNY